jgi:hypothetical protein
MEPHWNPMIEEQALSRVHRVGQKRNVSTIRYMMRDSVEEVCPVTTLLHFFFYTEGPSEVWSARSLIARFSKWRDYKGERKSLHMSRLSKGLYQKAVLESVHCKYGRCLLVRDLILICPFKYLKSVLE